MTGASFVAVTGGAVAASAALNASMAARNINTAALSSPAGDILIVFSLAITLLLLPVLLWILMALVHNLIRNLWP
jgi:hypothetical protein